MNDIFVDKLGRCYAEVYVWGQDSDGSQGFGKLLTAHLGAELDAYLEPLVEAGYTMVVRWSKNKGTEALHGRTDGPIRSWTGSTEDLAELSHANRAACMA